MQKLAISMQQPTHPDIRAMMTGNVGSYSACISFCPFFCFFFMLTCHCGGNGRVCRRYLLVLPQELRVLHLNDTLEAELHKHNIGRSAWGLLTATEPIQTNRAIETKTGMFKLKNKTKHQYHLKW